MTSSDGAARELIVEADGGSRGNPGQAGSGALVLDAATGEVLTELGLYVGIASNNVAEYKGMIAGVRAAIELDPQNAKAYKNLAALLEKMGKKEVGSSLEVSWTIY